MILVPSGKSKCKRCGRWFQPKNPDQEYGPTCEAKIRNKATVIEVRNKKGELTAVIV
jgi:hypothetical protein